MATVKGHTSNRVPLAIAFIFVLLGIIGLTYAIQPNQAEPDPQPSIPDLQVIDGTGRGPQAQQGNTGSALQGAARTQDLIQGRGGNDLQQGNNIQQGGSLDSLLKDKEIR